MTLSPKPDVPVKHNQSAPEDEQINCNDLQPFDLIGIGFGPANLSLSVRLAEQALNNTLLHPQLLKTPSADQPTLSRHLRTCFIDSNHRFRWHPGMMIDGSRMQISFLKDLVTLRNPCSPLSFLNYLHCHDRLVDFINRATFTPTRLEFADYLAWVARRVDSSSSSPSPRGKTDPPSNLNSIDVCYGERVVSVQGVRGTTGDIEFLRVSSTKASNGAIQQYLCRNLVISVGGTARVPRPFQEIGFESSKKPCYVLHTSTFLQHIDHILSNLIRPASAYPRPGRTRQQPIYDPPLDRSNSSSSINSALSSEGFTSRPSAAQPTCSPKPHPDEPRKIKVAVIGAGQSAAETLLETYNRLKTLIGSEHGLETSAEIDLLIKQGHLRPSDDSPFSNEVFNPQSTDFFYDLSAQELKPRMNSQSPIPAHERVNDILLKEAAATNYAVVSPETLSTLHEIIYSQKVEQGMEKGQLRDWGRPDDVKINIVNYTDVRAAEVSARGDGSIDVVLEHLLTGKTRRGHYEAVILGTGYSRQSWKEILFGRASGCPGSGSDISLRSLWPGLSLESPLQGLHISSEHSSDDSPTNSDIVSSGLSDEHEHDSCRSEPSSQNPPIDLHIARNYRLVLPETFVEPADPSTNNNNNNKSTVRKFRPTVWLQGCNERTHGISDSLLSVLAVRAGEIFDGLLEEGWFGDPPHSDK
ncbi:hypothetical protein PGT21_022854 [Puccinia graminis f. sp. tritici]|uniref:L-ornithine N(5)-monooxygenase [NAD(P)H] n=1 Tax=Puccinia graminis f. sp. tritici TaxID=56615 RepID=A0A5B0QIL5_PUCGR|nr:hypothetical protein PGT21_022854 [Puccinia graminis f. sp. tritici]